jgi:hypothetical protein
MTNEALELITFLFHHREYWGGGGGHELEGDNREET